MIEDDCFLTTHLLQIRHIPLNTKMENISFSFHQIQIHNFVFTLCFPLVSTFKFTKNDCVGYYMTFIMMAWKEFANHSRKLGKTGIKAATLLYMY